MFHPGDVANGRQLLLDGPDANVILPVHFILHCMKGKYHSTASSTDAESEAIFSTGVWHRVDVLLRKLSSRTSAYTPSTMFASQAMVQCLRLCASGPRCGQRPQAVACIDAALSNNQRTYRSWTALVQHCTVYAHAYMSYVKHYEIDLPSLHSRLGPVRTAGRHASELHDTEGDGKSTHCQFHSHSGAERYA